MSTTDWIDEKYKDYEGRCGPGCIPVCDFCQHWTDPRGPDQVGYLSEAGWCDIHKEKRDISDLCEHFLCMRNKGGKTA